MQTREQLQRRVAELEKQLEQMQRPGVRGVRRRADFEIANLPLYDIALGPDLAHGELRGHARGILAIGDIATGVIALGGLARGAIAIGGLAIGLVTFGGLSVGALVAAGGLAIGSLAFGGGAAGGLAIGGAAAGYYACGGAGFGEHVVAANRRDPDAEAFFDDHNLHMCNVRRVRRG